MKDDWVEWIKLVLEQYGIDPLYAVNILAFVILISYINDIRKWDELENWHKELIKATAFGTVILSLINILRITGFM